MIKKIISVLSPSGGTGKSTIIKELAIIYSSTKVEGKPMKVCIVDCNVVFGAQSTFFHVSSSHSLIDFVEDYRRLTRIKTFKEIDALYTWEYIEKYLTYVEDKELYLLSSPMEAPSPQNPYDSNVIYSELEAIVYALQKYFDVVLLDTGNNISETTLAALKLSNVPILVVTDNMSTVESASRMLKALVKTDVTKQTQDNIKIVYNMCPVGSMIKTWEKNEISQYLNDYPIIGCIPYYSGFWKLNNSARSLAYYKGREKVEKLQKAYFELAHNVINSN